jgi:hypothetical protein
MADYRLTTSPDFVVRNVDEAWIPKDPANRDYIQYEAWVAAGGVPDPIPPVIVPNLNSVGYGPTSADAVGA